METHQLATKERMWNRLKDRLKSHHYYWTKEVLKWMDEIEKEEIRDERVD